MERWIKLFDKFLEWEWFADANVVQMFIYLMLSANYENKKWRGRVIKRGQFLTSVRHLANDLHKDTKTVMRVLNVLKDSGCISVQSDHDKGSLITIVKYNDYQLVVNNGVGNIPTQNPTPTPTLTPTNIRNKEYKNIEGEVYAREENFENSDFSAMLKNDENWCETIAMNYHLTTEIVRKMVSEAAATFKLDNEPPRDYSSFRQRCRQYINCHYKRFIQNNLKPNNYGYDKSRFVNGVDLHEVGTSTNPEDYEVDW